MKVSLPWITYFRQRCCCIFLWFLFWENTSNQVISKENVGGFHRSIHCHHDCFIYSKPCLLIIQENWWIMSLNTSLFLQFAGILGNFEWLTCPRKVTTILLSLCAATQILKHIFVLVLFIEMLFWWNKCRIYLPVGFSVILIQFLCLSITPYQD